MFANSPRKELIFRVSLITAMLFNAVIPTTALAASVRNPDANSMENSSVEPLPDRQPLFFSPPPITSSPQSSSEPDPLRSRIPSKDQIEFTLTTKPAIVPANGQVQFHVYIRNHSDQAIDGLVYVDQLEDGLEFEQGVSDQVTYDARRREVRAEIGTLRAGERIRLSYTVTVAASRRTLLNRKIWIHDALLGVNDGSLRLRTQTAFGVGLLEGTAQSRLAILRANGGWNDTGRIKVHMEKDNVGANAMIMATPARLSGRGPDLQFNLKVYKTSSLTTDATGNFEEQAVSIVRANQDAFAQPAFIEINLDDYVDLKNIPAGQEPYVATYDEEHDIWVKVPILEQDIEENSVIVEAAHFSTWGAGLGSSVPQNGANVLLFDQPYTSLFTGSSRYSIPVWTPPGRNGMQPDIALSYSSGTVDGVLGDVQAPWVGVGWNIDEVEIVRKITTDENGYGYRNEFALTLNGSLYQLVRDEHQQNRYYTDKAAFLYIEHHNYAFGNDPSPVNTSGEWWEVVTTDGTRYRLGWNEDSEQLALMYGYACTTGGVTCYSPDGAYASLGYAGKANDLVALRWRVDRVTDTHGNYIEYEYFEEQPEGGAAIAPFDRESYLETISYTGYEDPNGIESSLAPAYEVKFITDDRSSIGDVPTEFNLWDNVDKKLLDMIKICYGSCDEAGSTTIRTYDFEYTLASAPNANGTLTLTSLQITGGDFTEDGQDIPKTEAPKIRFSYQNEPNRDVTGTTNDEFKYPRITSIDNGSGGLFTFEYETDGRGTNSWYNYRVKEVMVNSGDDLVKKQSYTYVSPLYSGEGGNPNLGSLIGYATVTESLLDFYADDVAIRETKHTFGTVGLDIGRELQTEILDGQGTVHRKTTNVYVTDNSQAPFDGWNFRYLGQTSSYVRSGGTLVQTSKATYYNDPATGNPLIQSTYLGSSLYRKTYFEYLTNPDPSVYIMDKATRILLVDAGNQIYADTRFYYDTSINNPVAQQPPVQGDVTFVQSFTGNGNETIDAWTEYDIYGNVTSQRAYEEYGIVNVAPTSAYVETSTEYETTLQTYPIKVKDPMGNDSHIKYLYSLGVPYETEDPNQWRTTTTYDGLGRTLSVTPPGLNQAGTQFIYPQPDANGNIESPHAVQMRILDTIVDPAEYRSVWGIYDGAGRMIQTQVETGDNDLLLNTTEFNAQGLVERQSLPYEEMDTSGGTNVAISGGQFTETEYDALGRAVKVTAPGDIISEVSYDGLRTTSTDPNGNKVVRTTDGLGRMQTIKEYNGLTLYATTQFAYDAADRLKTTLDAQGNITTLNYDFLGRKISMNDPDMGFWTYQYNALGNLVLQDDARFQTLSFEYDDLGRLLERRDVDNNNELLASYTYGGAVGEIGLRVGMTDSNDSSGSAAWVYSNFGRTITETRTIGGEERSITTNSDWLGRPISMVYDDGETISYIYDDLGRPVTLKSDQTTLVDLAYNTLGQIKTQNLNNGVVITNYYDEGNTNRLNNRTAEGATTLLDLSYAYDSNGNITRLTDEELNETHFYEYDFLNRLTSAVAASTVVSNPPATPQAYGQKFVYDQVGNMLQMSNWGAAPTQQASAPSIITENHSFTSYSQPGNYTVAQSMKPAQQSGFPSTTVLDDFNRANGSIGASWSQNPSKYSISSNQVSVADNSSTDIYWNVNSFGPDQEAYITLTQIDPSGHEQNLLLKAQTSGPYWNGLIEVLYDANSGVVQVWTYASGQDWVQHGADIPVNFSNGDQFGARATANGVVEVYQNGNLLASRDITTWPYYANGGYIGLWFIHSPNAIIDDFGGGDVLSGPTPTPTTPSTPTPTWTPTASSTSSPSNTPMVSQTPSYTPTGTSTSTPTGTSTGTPTFTPTHTSTATPVATSTPSPTPVFTQIPPNTPTPGPSDVEVLINSTQMGTYTLDSGEATSQSYNDVSGGPVEIRSSNGAKIIASLNQLRRRDATSAWTGVAQTMALPVDQISDKCVFPYYDYTQTTLLLNALRIANVDTVSRDITVTIGGTVVDSFTLESSMSTSKTYPDVKGGPVIVSSDADAKIIASLYELRKDPALSGWTGQSEMVGLPWSQLSDVYILPQYHDSSTLEASLFIANVDTESTTVEVTIDGALMGTYTLASNGTISKVYNDVSGGPVVIRSNNGAKIIASLNQLRRHDANGAWTGVAQTMALPVEQISNKYVFPYYDYTQSSDLYRALRIANVDTVARDITVTVGDTVVGLFTLGPSMSTSQTYPGVEAGPVIVSSDSGAKIIASLYELKKDPALSGWTGQSEMMGLPWSQLSAEYILPRYYDDHTLDASLLIANVDSIIIDSSQITEQSLMGYWSFDDVTGTSVPDEAPSDITDNDATLVNNPGTQTPGVQGASIFFNGIDQYATIADESEIKNNGGFTISAWINPAEIVSGRTQYVINKGVSSTVFDYGFIITSATGSGTATPTPPANVDPDGKLVFRVGDLTPNKVDGPVLPVDTWTLVTGVYDAIQGELRLYLNGTLAAVEKVTGTVSMGDGALTFSGASPNQFSGGLDEVGFYNRALINDEVKTLFESFSVPTPIPPTSTPVTATSTVAPTTTPLSADEMQWGTGEDGDITINVGETYNITSSSSKISGRTCSDAVAYNVGSLGSTIAYLTTPLDSGCLSAGDEVMLINLQGTSSSTYNTGVYEFLRVAYLGENSVVFTEEKLNWYGDSFHSDANIGTGVNNQKVMLIRVPNYDSVSISGTLTSNPWSGTRNGVVVFRAKSLTGSGTIQASGSGFYGGVGGYTYVSPLGNPKGTAGDPGEGIGPALTGGGAGGDGHNSSGGDSGGSASYGTNGTSGYVYGTETLEQIHLGSGGGGGGGGNNTSTGAAEDGGDGGRGGGLILFSVETINFTGSVAANGSNGVNVSNPGGDGGAGSGGSIRIEGGTITLGSVSASAGSGAGAGRIAVYSMSGTPVFSSNPTAYLGLINQIPTPIPSPTPINLTPTADVWSMAKDGDLTINSGNSFNISTQSQLVGRVCDDGGDGVSYSVVSLTASWAKLSSVPSSGCLNVGDEVMLINLQGTATNYGNTGNFEFVKVGGVVGNIVYFTNGKANFYGNNPTDDSNIGTGAGQQKVMLIRVPNYDSVVVNGTLTSNNWSGARDGIIVFRAISLTGSGYIASGRGFRGGAGGYTYVSPQGNPKGTNGNPGEGIGPALTGGGAGGIGRNSSPGSSGGGASYGTNGTSGYVYGTEMLDQIFLGSGGGGGGGGNSGSSSGDGGDGGTGSGATFLLVQTINFTGTIAAKGVAGENVANPGGDGGRGSGGSIRIEGETIALGSVSVLGGGGAGLGRIAIYYASSLANSGTLCAQASTYCEDTGSVAPTPTPSPTVTPTNTPLPTSEPGWTAFNYAYDMDQPHAVDSVDRITFDDTYIYDGNGNMTCRTEAGVTYTHDYNAENRISSINKMSGDCNSISTVESWKYVYDGDGVRVSTAHFTGSNPNPDWITRYYFGGALETTGSDVKKYYSFAGQTVAMNDNGVMKYFISDHLGSVSMVVYNDEVGVQKIEQQRYLPFGAPRPTPPYAGVTSTDFTYTGQRDLPGTGLMDYKARFFSPYINHFIQPDNIIPNLADPQSLNRYSYVQNNPIRYTDTTGHYVANGDNTSCSDDYSDLWCEWHHYDDDDLGRDLDKIKDVKVPHPSGNNVEINILAGITVDAQGYDNGPATIGLLYYSLGLVSDQYGGLQFYYSTKDQLYIPGSSGKTGGFLSGPTEKDNPSSAIGIGLAATHGYIFGDDFTTKDFLGPGYSDSLGVSFLSLGKFEPQDTNINYKGYSVGGGIGGPFSLVSVATNTTNIGNRIELPKNLIPVCRSLGQCGAGLFPSVTH